MIDPLDKPPSLIKTIQRIQDSIYSFLKEDSKMVWKGCGVSLVDIIENCFPDKNQPVNGQQSVAMFIVEPLLGFLKGGFNTMMQQGASFCIMHILEHFIANNYHDMIEEV